MWHSVSALNQGWHKVLPSNQGVVWNFILGILYILMFLDFVSIHESIIDKNMGAQIIFHSIHAFKYERVKLVHL